MIDYMFGEDFTLEDVMPFTFWMHFDGIDMSEYFYVQDDSGRGLMGKEIETVNIPSRPGGYASRSRRPIRQIQMSVILLAKDDVELRKQLETINDIFDVESPKAMVFSDEADRIYYGLPGSVSEGRQFQGFYQADITFLCTDPYKYGTEQPNVFSNGAVTITNRGTAQTKPIFDINVNEDVTFLQIAKDTGEYMQIGNPAAVDNVVVHPRPVVFRDDMSAIGNWTETNTVPPEGGVSAGSFVSDGSLFRPHDFGTGSSWHGPTLRHDLPKLLQDFYVEVVFQLNTYNARDIGRLELYLIDAKGNTLGKLAIKDNTLHEARNVVEIGFGDWDNRRYIVDSFDGYQRGSYNNFYGRLFIRRDGLEWWGQSAEQQGGAGGSYVNRSSGGSYYDAQQEYQFELAALQVHAATNGDHWEAGQMFIHHINVRELNQPTTSEIPVMAEAGDTITINHQNGEILLNGENVEYLKDFGANYFALEKGDNSLYAFPEDAFDITVKHQDRYL